MALASQLTWQTLIANYAAGPQSALIPLARDYYAQQGRLLSAASYLALSPAAASEPFLGNAQARELVKAPEFANAQAEADFWRTTTAAWLEQVQRQLDLSGRAQALATAWAEDPFGGVLENLYQDVAASYSIPGLLELPTNQLARPLWTAVVAVGSTQLAALLEQVRTAAQHVLDQNYPDADQAPQLLASLPAELVPLVQALVLPASGRESALLSVAGLAQPEDVTATLNTLPPNHAFAYALAEWLQRRIGQFMQAQQPASAAELPAARLSGQLLGQQGQPLPEFTLRLTQQAAAEALAPEAAAAMALLPRDLGLVRTGTEGRFELRLPRACYLDAADAVVELPTLVQAGVYYPGQETSGEAAAHFVINLSDADGDEHPYQTNLAATMPLPPSQAVAEVQLPAALSSLLAQQGLVALADVREAGGAARLVASQLPDDADAAQAARQLDGLAQFEVVASDAAFNQRVVAEGFYSLAQLVNSTTQAEFVARLTAADPTNAALGTQADEFYRRATATQALSQALGLLTAGRPVDNPATAEAGAQATQAPEATAPAEAARFSNPGVPESTTAPTQPNVQIVDGFNPPALSAPQLSYQPDGQCDCPACRSAVSPTAYLASLLNYATNNLRLATTAAAVTAGSFQTEFRQPFCDLSASCQAAEEQVCQYRLAVEILQAHWRNAAAPGTTFTVGQARTYVEGVLEALLQAVGTSLAELRAASAATLPTLADRLALPVAVVEQLQGRFTPAKLADSRTLDDVEADLAELFGLASTAVEPLRTGLLLDQLTTPASSALRLVRWQLKGVEYGINTDRDGRLCLQAVVGINKVYLTAYAGQPAEDNVVARGTLLGSGTSYTYTGQLYPQHGSGLSGAVVLTAKALGTTGYVDTTFTLAVVPLVTAGRQQTLAAEWLREDAAAVELLQAHTAPSWTGFRHLVDPDLLGPDDFRPISRSQANYLNVGLMLWRKRYEFLQYELIAAMQTAAGLSATAPLPGAQLGAVLDVLTQHTVTYTSLGGQPYTITPWSPIAPTGTALLTQVITQLASSQPADVQDATDTLNAFGWSPEAARRLYDLWQQSRTQTLTDAEVTEALDIVRQATKSLLSLLWAQEETDVNSKVDLTAWLFHRALHEPRVGIWEQARPAEFGLLPAALPLVDPDEVTPLDLPDAGFGDAAAALWSTRQAELLAKRQAILASGQVTPVLTGLARADAMLAYALRTLPQTPATVPAAPGGSLETAWTAYQSSASAQYAAAQTYFGEKLALRSAEVARLMDLRSQVQTTDADSLWTEMAAILTMTWKRAVAYRQAYVPEGQAGSATTPSWLAKEAAALPAGSLDRLIATRKHQLVKWRASAAGRARWVQALNQALERPLLDPDQLVPGDFRQAGERSRNTYQPAFATNPYGNPAFELYQQRQQYVQDKQASLLSDWSAATAAGRWGIVTSLLGCTQDELTALYVQQHASVDVSAPLRRLNLSSAGLDLLYSQLQPAASTPDQAGEVSHLLTQQYCYRKYADWAREEIALHITPTPYYFREPQTEAVSLATQPWRSSAVARRQWQRQLRARFEQMRSVTTAQQQAVGAAEDQYLGQLRDALLAEIGAATDSLADRAAAMEDQYLLDFQTVCCQRTTRVAQASTVLQKLFANVRGGLASHGLVLSAGDTTFENDWQWLGSYERWRSLMFLYLYPQNVLLPALKPGQTSQFRQTVSAIRQAASTTPADARGYMDDYQKFLADMATLQIATATETTLDAVSTDGFTPAGGRTAVSIQVALAASRIAYANVFRLPNGPGDQDYTWLRLPGQAPVERIAGSVVYQTEAGQRYLYVFAVLREEQKNALTAGALYLGFQRLSLSTLTWDEDYTTMTVGDTDTLDPSSVQVVASANEAWAPVVIGLRNRRVLLYTDSPFSQKAYSQNGVVDTGSNLELGRVLAENNHFNVDFFFAVLNPAGASVGLVQTRTIFLCVSAQLLSAVQVGANRILLCAALGVGSFRDKTLSIFNVKLADYGTQTRYLLANDFALPDALTSTAQPIFSSGSLNVYYRPVLANIKATLADALNMGFSDSPDFPVEDVGRPVVPTVPQTVRSVNSLASRYTSLVAAGGRITTTQVLTGTSTLTSYTWAVYFNCTALTTPTTFDTRVLTFDVDSGAYKQHGQTDITAQLTLPYSYQGPLLRTGYATSASATPTPTVVVSETNNGRYPLQRGQLATATNSYPLHSVLSDLPSLFSQLTSSSLDARHDKLATSIGTGPGFTNVLLSEAYYALPMLLAQELTRSRDYELALHYYRLVYDYTRQPNGALTADKRLVYPALASTGTPAYNTVLTWLTNPDNPYALASLRPNSHLEYVVMSVVRCLLAYADAEFTVDTSESVDRARTLYELAARLLKQDITQYAVPGTAELLDPLDDLFPAAWLAEWQALKAVLARVNQRAVLEQVLHKAAIDGVSNRGLAWLFTDAQQSNRSWAAAFDQAWQVVNVQLAALPGGYQSLCTSASSPLGTTIPTLPSGVTLPTNGVRPYVPFLGGTFCVPTNPVPFALALHAELNLFKIRSCRNIAGIQRELDPYAAATDNTTGLPTLSSTGQLVRSGRLVVPATQFRYAYIMERARNLVALAQQTEASLLAALEKRDAEAYGLLKARQDIATSQATVQLQTLRVTEAEDGVDLADLQLEKSQFIEDQYTDWLDDGLNGWEIAQLSAVVASGLAHAAAEVAKAANVWDNVFSFGGSAIGAGYAAIAAIADATAQFSGLQATYARREQEWNFQKNLAAQDIKINQQQIKIANDQVKVVGQEKRIAQLNLDHATAVLNFLTTKFTNAELYDWMSGILESAYSYFLQQATATARLAEQQLAFERQEVPAGIVQADYYSAPVDDMAAISLTSDGSSASATDRKGLTGSVRLLQDLTRLDEYAFETTKRKLQLTKTISLAQNFPAEFVRFRDTGLLSFACQPEWFDQDFPGHYLRVLRRVRTSVIALVPTVDGIKARLGTAGTSHVTVDGTPFQTLALPRAPEGVALTSPSNATGLFELEQQSTELLYPFEGLGVDVPWTFSMQPASNPNLDYSAVADVLVTLDYTALESADYARQVVQRLGTERQQQVVLSLRNRFADQWYDLHHAGEVDPAQQYVSTLTITADDLPRSLRGAQVSQVSLFVDAPLDDDPSAQGAFTDRSQLALTLTRGAGRGGEARTNQYGLISTRTGTGTGPLYTGNATAFVPLIGTTPAGDWTLTVGPGRLRDRLAAGLVDDIYLILEVTGDVPAYVL